MAAGGSEDYVAGDLRVEQGGETGAVGWLRRRALGGRAEFPVLPSVRGVLQQDVQPVDREIANQDWSAQERCGFDLRADARHSRHDGLGATRQIVELQIAKLDMDPTSRCHMQRADGGLALERGRQAPSCERSQIIAIGKRKERTADRDQQDDEAQPNPKRPAQYAPQRPRGIHRTIAPVIRLNLAAAICFSIPSDARGLPYPARTVCLLSLRREARQPVTKRPIITASSARA